MEHDFFVLGCSKFFSWRAFCCLKKLTIITLFVLWLQSTSARAVKLENGRRSFCYQAETTIGIFAEVCLNFFFEEVCLKFLFHAPVFSLFYANTLFPAKTHRGNHLPVFLFCR
jgi:heme exporter protein D